MYILVYSKEFPSSFFTGGGGLKINAEFIIHMYLPHNFLGTFEHISLVSLFILQHDLLCYPRATRCGGDIVTLLWFCACVCASGHGPCEHDRN